MKNILGLTNEQRKVLFETTAREMNISTVVIEKDFWVCVVLNYLFCESKFKDYFIFKGGTSLSKCYDVIKRFSEDVDLVLKWDKIGFTDDEVYESRTITQNQKFEDLMNNRGASFIQNELKNDLVNNFAAKIDDMEIITDQDDPMILYVKYPASSLSSYIPPIVKLEIGPVAAKTPTEQKMIEPYCLKYYHLDHQGPVKIETVTLARTFWEKLLILAAETNRPLEKKMPARYSRHYYDVLMMYQSPYFPEIIKDKKLFDDVKIFKSKYYRLSWSKIDQCTLKNIHLIPSENRLREIKLDYGHMQEMLFGNQPSFDELIHGLGELEKTLHDC